MEIKTSKGVNYVNADYTIEEKQGEYPKLTCTIPASKNKIWIDDCKELDRLYTPGEQDEFVIINPVKITKGDSYDLEITAVGAFEFDFVKSRINDNLPTRSYTVEYLLDLVFKDTRYSYDLQGTYEKREFTNFGSDNRYKLFLQIMNRFNLEFKIIGKIVRINSKIGNDTGFQFRYLKNIKDTKYSVDATNLVTHVKGYGAYHDANDQSKGRLEVEYLSPLSDIYGKLSGEPVVDERMSISATLLEKCKQSVESSVAVTVSTTLVALKNQEYRGIARVGDSIWFIDERIELEKKIRFSTVKSYYDAFDELIKQDVQLGDKDVFSRAQSSDSASQSKLIDKQKELSDQLADVEDAIKKTYVMPSGVNRVFYSSDLPEDVPKGTIKEGDTLFRNIDGETKMYRWDGVQWELVPVVNDVEKFREELDNEITQVNQSMQAQSEEHDRQVADILSKTQSIESLANQAKTDAASAIARANQVKTEAIADARAQVATVSQALNTAKSELQSAIASADQKARDSQASATVLRNDLNLQASKILAQAQAQTALTNRVTTVETLADGTKTTVAELSKTVSKATGDIASVLSRTKTVEDTLSQTRTQYETLTQTINTQTGQIDSINRKTADLQSGIDGVTERFENIKIGSRNYLRNASFDVGDSNWYRNQDPNLVYDFSHSLVNKGKPGLHLHSETHTAIIGKFRGISQRFKIQQPANTDYVLSLDLAKDGVSSDANIGLHFIKNGEIKQQAWFKVNKSEIPISYKRFVFKATSTYDVDEINVMVYVGYNMIVNLYVTDVQLEVGNIASDFQLSDEDLRSEFATYIRTATENSAELVRRIETADGKAVEAKTYAQQTAEGFKTRLESLETYKNEEGTRASQYLTASRTETAKQLTAERAAISANYVAKSVYDEDARGTTLKLNEIKSTADTAKQNLATYQNTVDRKLEELTSSTQTLDGKINTASSKVDTVAGQIRTEISEVEGKIPTTIGATNYIRDFGFAKNHTFYENTSGWRFERIEDSTARSGYHIKATCTRAGSSGFHRWLHDLRGTEWQGRTMTYSVDVKASKSVRMRLGVEAFNKGLKAFDVTRDWQRFVSTDTISYKKYYSFSFYTDAINWAVEDIVYIRDPQLEDGNIATTPHAAAEDLMAEISSVKTTITNTARGVEQLSSEVSNVGDKITTAETKISNLVGEVSSKVSQTDYNTLTGRVDDNATAITQNAQEISKRLTKTQVDKAITDKGYQTKSDVDSNITGRGYITNSALQPYALSTTVQNLVEETADSFGRTISETKALIPTSIGSRNYIRNGDFSDESTHWEISLPRANYNLAHSLSNKGKSGLHWYTESMPRYSGVDQVIPNVVGMAGQRVAVSLSIAKDGVGGALTVHLHYRDSSGEIVGQELKQLPNTFSRSYRRYNIIFTAPTDFKSLKLMLGSPVGQLANIYITDVQLELADVASDYHKAIEDLATVTALHSVRDTVDSHTRTIGAVGTAGSILDNVSKVTQTANGLVTEVTGEGGLKTQVSTLAGSYAIKNLTSSGNVLNQLNLNKDGSVKIDGKLVQITGATYIQDGVISAAKIGDLSAGKITSGTLDAARIKANSIGGSKIAFDEAFFNGLTANEAYLEKLFAKNAFITSVQAVTLSASKIAGGVMEATNGAMKVDLNNANITFNQNATINFNSANNALVRRKGAHTAFVHFNDVNSSSDGGVGSLYASIGVTSSGDGIDSASSGRFAGLRAFRGARGLAHDATLDQLELYGDRVLLMDDFDLNRGFMFRPAALSRADFIDMNQLVTCVRALRDMWVHYKNTNGRLSELLNNRSNSNVNASWENMHSFK